MRDGGKMYLMIMQQHLPCRAYRGLVFSNSNLKEQSIFLVSFASSGDPRETLSGQRIRNWMQGVLVSRERSRQFAQRRLDSGLCTKVYSHKCANMT